MKSINKKPLVSNKNGSMEQVFRLTQLYKCTAPELIMGTCHIHNNEDDNRFEVKINGDANFKAQLWQWVTGNWNGKNGIACKVLFTDVTIEGLPCDGCVTSIEGFNAINLT
jgi:hypothetical protein